MTTITINATTAAAISVVSRVSKLATTALDCRAALDQTHVLIATNPGRTLLH